MVDKDLFTLSGDVDVSKISDCSCHSTAECERKCDKYYHCNTIAMANDILKEYEEDKKYEIAIVNIDDSKTKVIKINSSLEYVLKLRRAIIQDIINELYRDDIIDKYAAEDIVFSSKEFLDHYEIEEAGVILEVNEGWENLKKIWKLPCLEE